MFAFLLKASRPGFWLTSVWFYLLPVGKVYKIDDAVFWLGIIFVTFPLGLAIYGWNDVTDAATDRANARKDTYLFGAAGRDAQLQRLPSWIAIVMLPFLGLFCYLIDPIWILLWTLAFCAVNISYNHPSLGFKRLPVLDMLNQTGYLLVFVLSSWLNQLPQLPWQTFVFGALFAMHSHLFGQIMDIEPDKQAGRRTTAIVTGPIGAKWLLVCMLLFEALWVYHFFGDTVIAGFLIMGAAAFVLDVALLFGARPYSNRVMALFLIIWNLVALASSAWVWQNGTLTQVL